jgi:hypothetical protein
LLVYDQQIHTCLLSDHQRIIINFMYECDEHCFILYSHYMVVFIENGPNLFMYVPSR